MFKNLEGQRVPDVTFRTQDNGQWKTLTTADLFADKTVIVFSLPGAFTPTCSSAHVPRYDQLAAKFKQLGVDDILCISVNDAFVMEAWRKDQDAKNVRFIPDGNGEFTEKMGMLVGKEQLGFGKRSWRYSMLVRNGIIEKMFIEPDKEGDPYEVSDADTMLKHLAPNAPANREVVLFTKQGCGHCARARSALEQRGIGFEEVRATPGMLMAVSGRKTTPQVFVDGKHIGGADELMQWLETNG